MKLVDYPESDSDDDSNVASEKRGKRKRSSEAAASPRKEPKLAPSQSSASLPDIIGPRLSAYDDPSLHGGRARITPHVVGNWPSHVYLEWLPTPEECKPITQIITRLQRFVPPKFIHPLHVDRLDNSAVPQRLHISLSTSLYIKTEQRHLFLEHMARAVKENPFVVRFTGIKWAANYNGNRWFLVLECEQHLSLHSLLERTNSVAASFGQKLLYEKRPQERNALVPAQPEPARPMAETGEASTDKVVTGDELSSPWIKQIEELKQQRERASSGTRTSVQEEHSRETHPIEQPQLEGWMQEQIAGFRLQPGGQGDKGGDSSNNEQQPKARLAMPFHVSIAWILEPPPFRMRDLKNMSTVKRVMREEISQIHPLFDRVKVKVGDNVTQLPLGDVDGDRYVWDNGQRISVPRWHEDASQPWTVLHQVYNMRYGTGDNVPSDKI